MIERPIRANRTTLIQRAKQWEIIRDCMEGERRIKGLDISGGGSNATTYLPRPSGMRAEEGSDPYEDYKARAVFYNVVSRTVRGITGLIFRVSPTIALPPKLESLRKSITPRGVSIETYMRYVVRELLSVGRHGWLVEFTGEKAADPVGRLVPYDAENIIYWEEALFDGERRPSLIELRLGTPRTPIDTSKDKDLIDDILQLAINDAGVYEQRRFERAQSVTDPHDIPAGAETRVVQIRGQTLTKIPFWFLNPYDLDPAVEVPPAFDLAMMNLAHYRNSADYEHSLYLTAQPTPVFTGVTEDEEKKITALGPGAMITLAHPDAKASMLEFQGHGIAAQQQAMADKEARMAALGAQMIRAQKRAAETAEKARLDALDETSLAIEILKNLDHAFEGALRLLAEWAKADPEKVSVKFNTDLIETRMSAQELTALVAAWQQGAMSEDLLWANFQRGKIAPPDRSLEEDKALREDQGGGVRFKPVPAREGEGEEPKDDDEPDADDAAA